MSEGWMQIRQIICAKYIKTTDMGGFSPPNERKNVEVYQNDAEMHPFRRFRMQKG